MQLIPIQADGSTPVAVEPGHPQLTQVIQATVALYGHKGFHPPWIGYLGEEAGFAGPPENGEVEIAYFTFPEFERKGVATRMAQELIRLTQTSAGDVRYIAHTLPEESASTALLRRLGFQCLGDIQHPEDGRVWKWKEDSRRQFEKGSLAEKFARIQEHWRPKIVAEANGQELKLVKLAGIFPWHQHEQEDELFLVWRGEMIIEYRDRRLVLNPGEFCVVPRGVEHRTLAHGEAEVLIFEPAATRNTGNVTDEHFTAPNGVKV
jgi:mannose-6-phosphate isomerase-like protein (cupin superfamily)